VTSPSADIPPEDQRRQYGQYEEDKAGIKSAILEGVHRLRRLDRRDGAAHDLPLNIVADHQQCEDAERNGSPNAGARTANACGLRRGRIGENRKLGPPRFFYVFAFAAAFHKKCR